AENARPLASGLKAVAAETGHMQENVGQILIWNEEAVSLRWIEPPHRSRYLEDINYNFFVCNTLITMNMALEEWRFFCPHCQNAPRLTTQPTDATHTIGCNQASYRAKRKSQSPLRLF